MVLAHGKKYEKCDKMNHFKEVCKSTKGSTVNNKEIEDIQEQETDIEMVTINSIRYNFNLPKARANLNTSLDKVAISVFYKVYIGSNGSIMPFYIYKKLFPRATVEQLAARKDTKIKLKMYNQSTVTQLGTCRVTLENNNKFKILNFFVFQGNGQAFIRYSIYQITKHSSCKLQHNRHRKRR